MSSRSQRYLRLSCPRSATFCPRAAVFPSWGVLDFGAVWQASMRCHFWVNGRNSPPLACSSSAYTPVAVQQNSPPQLHHLGPHLTRRLGTSVQPWRYPHASGGEGRDGERGKEWLVVWWVSYFCCLALETWGKNIKVARSGNAKWWMQLKLIVSQFAPRNHFDGLYKVQFNQQLLCLSWDQSYSKLFWLNLKRMKFYTNHTRSRAMSKDSLKNQSRTPNLQISINWARSTKSLNIKTHKFLFKFNQSK